jgi:hypothetical protein
LEIVQPRFQKFNSKYIESIKIVRAISWVRGTFHTSWLILTAFEGVGILYGISSASAKGTRNLLGSGGIFPLENFEFLDSLEHYFMYSRTRFERKVTTTKSHF